MFDVQFTGQVDVEREGEEIVLRQLLQVAEDFLLRGQAEHHAVDIADDSLHILDNIFAARIVSCKSCILRN